MFKLELAIYFIIFILFFTIGTLYYQKTNHQELIEQYKSDHDSLQQIIDNNINHNIKTIQMNTILHNSIVHLLSEIDSLQYEAYYHQKLYCSLLEAVGSTKSRWLPDSVICKNVLKITDTIYIEKQPEFKPISQIPYMPVIFINPELLPVQSFETEKTIIKKDKLIRFKILMSAWCLGFGYTGGYGLLE